MVTDPFIEPLFLRFHSLSVSPPPPLSLSHLSIPTLCHSFPPHSLSLSLSLSLYLSFTSFSSALSLRESAGVCVGVAVCLSLPAAAAERLLPPPHHPLPPPGPPQRAPPTRLLRPHPS